MAVNGVAMSSRNEKLSATTLDEAMLLSGFGMYNVLHMLMCGLILMGVIMQSLALGYVMPAAQCDLELTLQQRGWLAAIPFAGMLEAWSRELQIQAKDCTTSLILTGVIMQSLALGYVMPAAQCDLELTLQQRGWLAAIPFAAIILTSYFWGWLADTQGRRPVMLSSMAVSAVFSVLTSFAPNLISFAILQFISSVFMSGPSAVVYTYLGEFNSLRHRDKMVAFGSSFVGIGTVVLPGISWLILPLEFYYPMPFLDIAYRPWRLLVVACAMPYAISTIFLMFAPESPKFLNAVGQYEECLEVVKTIYSANQKQPRDSFPVQTLIVENHSDKDVESHGIGAVLRSMRDQTVPLFKRPLLPWTCLTCFVQFGIFATTNGFYVWFPSILNSLANHDGGEARICDILDAARTTADNGTIIECNDTMNTETFERSIYIGLVFSSMYILVGFLVDFVGKKPILVAILSVTGMCGIGAHLVHNSQVGVVLFAIFQMSGACIGLMTAVAVELFPTKYRAMAVCLSMMMGRVGSMAGSNLIGVFLQTNCGISFYLFGGIIIVNAVFCLTLPGRKDIPIRDTVVEPAENETHEPV